MKTQTEEKTDRKTDRQTDNKIDSTTERPKGRSIEGQENEQNIRDMHEAVSMIFASG